MPKIIPTHELFDLDKQGLVRNKTNERLFHTKQPDSYKADIERIFKQQAALFKMCEYSVELATKAVDQPVKPLEQWVFEIVRDDNEVILQVNAESDSGKSRTFNIKRDSDSRIIEIRATI